MAWEQPWKMKWVDGLLLIPLALLVKVLSFLATIHYRKIKEWKRKFSSLFYFVTVVGKFLVYRGTLDWWLEGEFLIWKFSENSNWMHALRGMERDHKSSFWWKWHSFSFFNFPRKAITIIIIIIIIIISQRVLSRWLLNFSISIFILKKLLKNSCPTIKEYSMYYTFT